jgi:hypothetical protein
MSEAALTLQLSNAAVAAADGGGPWYFRNPENVSRLFAQRAHWEGTPFRKGSCVPGPAGGSDCVCLAESMLHGAGAVPRFHFPRKSHDYSEHVIHRRVLEYLRGHGRLADGSIDPQSLELGRYFAELPELAALDRDEIIPLLLPGDIPILKSGVDLFHMPIMMQPPLFSQCIFPAGVCEGQINDPQYHEHLVTLFRVRAEPLPLS